MTEGLTFGIAMGIGIAALVIGFAFFDLGMVMLGTLVLVFTVGISAIENQPANAAPCLPWEVPGSACKPAIHKPQT